MITFHLPILLISGLLLSSFLIPIIATKRGLIIPYLTQGINGVAFLVAAYLLYHVNRYGNVTYELGNWPPPWGIELAVDLLGAYMGVIITGLGFLILLFSFRDIQGEVNVIRRGWFYTLYMLILGGMVGVVYTNDLFNLYVMSEIITISATGLVAIRNNRLAVEAAFKYLIMLALGSGPILLGIALVYMVTGHLNFAFVGDTLGEAMELYPRVILLAQAFFIVGFGIKAALFPLHTWLPDAYSFAPSATSALLAGLATKVYLVALLRVLFNVFGLDLLLATPLFDILKILAVAGIMFGSLVALRQTDLKRLLSYSCVAQIGYIFLGLSLLTEFGVAGSILHILNHAMIKSMVFLCAGVLIYKKGTSKIRELGGAGWEFPVTMTCFGVGGFAMVGIPLFNGFISKWYISLGAVEYGGMLGIFYLFIIIVSSLLNGLYYLPVLVKVFLDKGTAQNVEFDKLSPTLLIPIVILALGVIFLGIIPFIPMHIATTAAETLLAR